jgi:hypothetical protein
MDRIEQTVRLIRSTGVGAGALGRESTRGMFGNRKRR